MAMKLTLIALLFFGAALASHQGIEEWDWLNSVSPNRKIQDSTFRSGREYHFFYNGQLASGIAGASKQHSANRIQAIVCLAMKNQDSNVVLKLQNVRFGKMNRQIPNPRKMMPFDAFEETQIEQKLKQKLEAPVKFSYTGGLVRDVEFDSKEDPWSANIKRGVLNLLQVNLQQHRRQDAPEETRLTNTRQRNDDDQQAQFFRVMEETLEGECETLYTIQQQPPQHHTSNRPVLNVTKSINFEKCNKRPQVKYNFRFNSKCPTCQPKYDEDEKFLKSSTVVQFNITGTKQNFLIESARTESQYVFTPFNEEANVIVTYVNQTLVLVKSGPIEHGQEPQNPIRSDSNMVFTLDWDVAHEKFSMHGGSSNGDSAQQRILQTGQQGVNRPEMVKKILHKMTNQMQKEHVDEEVPQKFTHLVHWLRQCDQQELEQFTRQIEQGGQSMSPEQEKKAKNIVPQALGACGTKECVKQLTQKIRQGHIGPWKGVLALKQLVHNRVASKDIVNELIQLAESDKAQQHQPLKRSAWLAAGSLINALCAENDDQLALEAKEDAKKLCGRDQKDKYVQILFNKLRQSNKWQDKVLMLKTIGNAGLDLSIFELEKIIKQQDPQQRDPMYVRMEAILALRELKDDMPKKIQRLLMPVAMNRREYPTIRSVATYMIFQTQPERPILDQLARNLINEPSHQYAAFVYTQLESYANSTNPCEQQLATDCKLALRQAKKVSTGLGYSKLSHNTFHNKNQQIGLDLDFGAVYSNTSAIPRFLGANLHVNALGYWQKQLATATLFNEGLEPLIRQFANEQGQFKFLRNTEYSESSNSLINMLRRHPRSTRRSNSNNNNGASSSSSQQDNDDRSGEANEYERELNDIFSKHLRIRHRQYNDEYQNQAKAYLTGMYKSQTMAMVPIGEEILQQLAQDAQTKGGDFLQKLQRGVQVDYATVAQLHDQQLKIPTTLGLPLAVTIEAPLAVSVKGRIQANVESLKPSKTSVKLQADLKPSAVATFTCQVEAWSPVTTTGVKVQAKAKVFVPFDAKLDIEAGQSNQNTNGGQPQIKATIRQPTQKRDLVVLESRPITFTRSWQQYLRNADEQTSDEEQTIIGEELNRVTTFNKCGGKKTLGVDVCVRGQIQQCGSYQQIKGTPFSPLSGQNKIVVTAQPSQSSQDIQIKINAQVQKLNGQDIQKPSFDILGQSQGQDQYPFQNDDYSDSVSTEDDDYDGDYQQNNDQQRRRQQDQQRGSDDSQQSSNERRQQRQRRGQQQQRQRQQNQRQRQNQQHQGLGTRIFQQYRNYQVKKGYKTQINVDVQAGSEGKLNFQLAHLYDSQQRYGKINMKFHRQQPEQWQACFDGEMMFPQQPQFVNEVKEKKILAQAQLRWGQTCNERNYIQITTQAERSRQQIDWERRQKEYTQYNSKQQCQRNKAWCSPLTQQDFVEKIGQMLRYRVDIDYQNVPQSVKNATNKLYRALKHYYFWQTDVDQINVQNPENKIRAEFVLDAQTKQRLNITIKTPKENTMIQDMPLNKPIMVLNQKQSFGDQLNDYVNDQDFDDDQAQCSVTGKQGWQRRSQVETFDGTKFSAPFTDCWVVLAKDCGSSKPEFVVLARKAPRQQQQQQQDGDLKEVKIITRKNRIQLTPDSDEYGSVKVMVNGQQKNKNNDQGSQEIEDHGHVVAKIDQQGPTVNVELPEAGVEVDFDGYAINVQLSQYYQGQQCGLCGHFDKESADEFRNPDFTEEQDVRQFYLNYLIKDNNCQAPRQLSEVCQDKDCDQDDTSSSSSSSSSSQSTSSDEDGDNDETTEKPYHKTKVIEMDDQICFSTVPVPQCDDDSYPIQIKQQKQVPYACVDQDSESAERFEQQARYGRKAVQGMTNRQPNFTRTESIPEKCKKYNKN